MMRVRKVITHQDGPVTRLESDQTKCAEALAQHHHFDDANGTHHHPFSVIEPFADPESSSLGVFAVHGDNGNGGNLYRECICFDERSSKDGNCHSRAQCCQQKGDLHYSLALQLVPRWQLPLQPVVWPLLASEGEEEDVVTLLHVRDPSCAKEQVVTHLHVDPNQHCLISPTKLTVRSRCARPSIVGLGLP